ncbi:retrovirus-related Pol polyprotein from transposon 17.6 [Trichonephila clavipes]|nr:retrovirus-related Pol polyprotein from transposon 17.6 [Trichonephila clavipes]
MFPTRGEPTPYIEHRINTGDHPPHSNVSYSMNPVKKEVLREQIEELLRQDEVELGYESECLTLPRMNDLPNEAIPTSFMSTIDLQSDYYQVKVADVDQDKTAFICLFGTYRYLRMPFGLRNAPETFQRLIDKF